MAYQAAQMPDPARDPAGFWSWVSQQTPAEQQRIISERGAVVDGQFSKSDRANAFKAGVILPGVTSSGLGTGLTKDEIALVQQSHGIDRAQTTADSQSQNIADYTVNPVNQADEVAPQYRHLGQVEDPRFVTLDRAINQSRTDTTGYDAQRRALLGYQDIYDTGGLTAIDRARMAEAQARRGVEARSRELGVMRDMAEQGRGGGNAAMLARLQARQAGTQAIAQDDLATQAMALQRRDAALGALGNLGGSVQSATDAIDQFNTQGERDRALANLNTQNQGISMGWEENRGRERINTAQDNQGINAAFVANTAVHAGNTADQRDANRFNAGPSGGARGMFRDKLAGDAALLGQYDNAGNLLHSMQQDEDTADAQARAAYIGAVTDVVKTPVDAFTKTQGWTNLGGG